MDPPTLQALLPCYLCGDLPPELMAQMDAALAADPALQARLDTLGAGREACRAALEALAEAAPDLDLDLDLGGLRVPDELEDFDEEAPTTVVPLSELLRQEAAAAPAPAAAPTPPAAAPAPSPPALPGLLLGLAAAAALVLAAATSDPAVPAEAALLAVHDAAAADGPAFIEATTGAELVAAFSARGVAPRLAKAPDLSKWGYTLVGGMVSEGRPGVAVVYEKDGQRYVCQIYGGMRTHSRPDAVQREGGVVVRGFQQGDRAIVEWSAGGRTCLFSGPGELSGLMAVITDRIRAGRAARRG